MSYLSKLQPFLVNVVDQLTNQSLNIVKVHTVYVVFIKIPAISCECCWPVVDPQSLNIFKVQSMKHFTTFKYKLNLDALKSLRKVKLPF